MDQLFCNENIKEFFLKLNASYLHGGNINKYFIVYSGKLGNNGKSTIASIMKRVMGDYYVEVPTSVLTGKRGQSGQASPEMARLGFARIAGAKETDGDDKLQLGQIKEMTGNDAFFARFLHDNGRDIEPQFKLLLHCNDVPGFNHTDQAMINRMLNIPFLSVWTLDAPDTEEEQKKTRRFKMDPLFKDQTQDYAEALLWVLIHYYKKFSVEGLVQPREIIEYTENYWKDNDIYKQFVDQELVEEPDSKRREQIYITSRDLYTNFKKWLEDLHPSHKKVDSNMFLEKMDRILTSRKHHKYFGWSLNATAYDNSAQ
jgi:phage/plasmid-associated DNA primase